MISAQQQLETIKRGTSEIIPSPDVLLKKIKEAQKEKRPLRVKAGFDPTASDIHLGHTVLLRKLRHFQELGHKVIFLIGDATSLVGDPSGQSETRKTLTRKVIDNNALTYEKQVSKILNTTDPDLFERRHNSEWFSRGKKASKASFFTFENFVELAQKYTVARLIERDDFEKRLKENKPISFLELFYPLMQGYDSVRLESDIEIGGTDQKFNMLVGRDLQRAYKNYDKAPQVVITLPILEGTDGTRKMSKSLDNYIGINEPAGEIFGKIMSISDQLMWKYYQLLTDVSLEAVKDKHPLEAKKNLARIIVSQYCGNKNAEKALLDFERTFQKRDPFTGMKVREIPIDLATLSDKDCFFLICSPQVLMLVNNKDKFQDLVLVNSKNEFRELIKKSITVNGKKVTDLHYRLEPNKEYRIKVGKRRFSKIILRLQKKT